MVLALKLAELQNLTQSLGEAPLLLLDDVASELDAKRRSQLLEHLANQAGQTVVTTTEKELFPLALARSHYRVESGMLVADGLG